MQWAITTTPLFCHFAGSRRCIRPQQIFTRRPEKSQQSSVKQTTKTFAYGKDNMQQLKHVPGIMPFGDFSGCRASVC